MTNNNKQRPMMVNFSFSDDRIRIILGPFVWMGSKYIGVHRQMGSNKGYQRGEGERLR